MLIFYSDLKTKCIIVLSKYFFNNYLLSWSVIFNYAESCVLEEVALCICMVAGLRSCVQVVISQDLSCHVTSFKPRMRILRTMHRPVAILTIPKSKQLKACACTTRLSSTFHPHLPQMPSSLSTGSG